MTDATGLRAPKTGLLHATERDRRIWRFAEILRRRREHKSAPHWEHRMWSPANGLTALRTVVAITLLAFAAAEGSRRLLVAGLLTSWIGDMIDGHIARTRECETVLGAQIDGLADRLTAILVVVSSSIIDHGGAVAIAAGAAVWLQFGVVDHVLSAQFLRYGLWSPDEFHLQDLSAWRVNWAPFAKILSNIPVGLLALGGQATWGALAGAVVLLAIRANSSLRLLAGLQANDVGSECQRLEVVTSRTVGQPIASTNPVGAYNQHDHRDSRVRASAEGF
jgi:CDP-diacylglycerol---glycerol-3-phosphate 3-phosphatidyltransferase